MYKEKKQIHLQNIHDGDSSLVVRFDDDTNIFQSIVVHENYGGHQLLLSVQGTPGK